MASHIGRLPITLPKNVEITVEGNKVTAKGPKGVQECIIPDGIEIKQSEGSIEVIPTDPGAKGSSARHGLARALVASIVQGVSSGFDKKLEIVGTGYRVTAKGPDLNFALGYSHDIPVKAPEGITFTVADATHLTVSGINKQQVGEVAAQIHMLRPPEPYKGKGIRYAGEHVRRKAGKAGK